MRQVDDSELHFPLYLGAILLATVVATAMLHRFDVYREDFLYSKRIPYGSLFAAWTVTFCILLAAAFLMKMSESYSRAWALSWRSEEHTSELQSLMRISYAVFCLKKKTNQTMTTTTQDDNTGLKTASYY